MNCCNPVVEDFSEDRIVIMCEPEGQPTLAAVQLLYDDDVA